MEDKSWADLTRFGAEGEAVTIEGTVFDGDGSPMTDACVEIWQSSPSASEKFPAFGRAATDASGHFSFKTLGDYAFVDGLVLAFIIFFFCFSYAYAMSPKSPSVFSGGFGATKIYKFGAGTPLGKCVAKSWPNTVWNIPASANPLEMDCPSSSENDIKTPKWPVASQEFPINLTLAESKPEFRKIFAISYAYVYASGSALSNSIKTSISNRCLNKDMSFSCCSKVTRLQAVNCSIRAALARASLARSFASPNRILSISETTWPNLISPYIPNATTASAIKLPILNQRCPNGETHTVASSTIANRTAHAAQVSIRSGSSSNSSRWDSVASLTVFARRKTLRGPRPEWAIAAGILIGLLLALCSWIFK